MNAATHKRSEAEPFGDQDLAYVRQANECLSYLAQCRSRFGLAVGRQAGVQ